MVNTSLETLMPRVLTVATTVPVRGDTDLVVFLKKSPYLLRHILNCLQLNCMMSGICFKIIL